MPTCFVIQPFDGGRFDKRYEDVYVPAIIAAELEPYRVDKDVTAEVPIESIEQGIQSAAVCLADITLDNPNVWFELGYAFASGKSVVMLCSTERTTKFPFDVQHRSIITYKSESASDFDDLKTKITKRLSAALEKTESLGKIARATPLSSVEGLSQHELITLAAIAENLSSPDDNVPVYLVKKDIEMSGFTRMAAILGIKSLTRKEMIVEVRAEDERGGYYTAYKVTSTGWDWILANEEVFQIKSLAPRVDDDPPF